jgi:hypothetical protein
MLPGERSSPRNLLAVLQRKKGLTRSFLPDKTAEHKCILSNDSLIYSILLHSICYSIPFDTQEEGCLHLESLLFVVLNDGDNNKVFLMRDGVWRKVSIGAARSNNTLRYKINGGCTANFQTKTSSVPKF